MSLHWILLCLAGQAGDEAPTTRALAALLARAATADDVNASDASASAALVAPLAKELRALGEIDGLLLEVLVDGRVPDDGGPDGDETGAARHLGAFQERVVLEALCAGAHRAADTFLEEVRAHPESVERVAVALRLLGRIGRTNDLACVRALLQTVGSREGGRVEEAFERGLLDWLTREPKLFEALPALCDELSTEQVGVVVRVLTKTDSPAAPRCLRKLLGSPDALQACVLQALASTAERVPRDEAPDLAEELQSHLDSGDESRAVAAANALGRLRVAGSIPALIAHMSDEPPLARATLAALRAISGTNLAASSIAWRRWYAAEESWWRERAPSRMHVLAQAVRAEPDRAHLVAALGEISEHPLHRDELAPVAAAGLECRDPGLRVLTCAALERLGSRAALPFLWAHLEDADEGVAGHVHRVMRTLARVDLPCERDPWAAWLRESGFALDDDPVGSRP